MWETWEQATIERLEKRVAELERKNRERSDRVFRWIMYAYMAVFIALAIAAVAIGASHPAH
jgi:hypothetical protein